MTEAEMGRQPDKRPEESWQEQPRMGALCRRKTWELGRN